MTTSLVLKWPLLIKYIQMNAPVTIHLLKGSKNFT